MKTKTIVFSNPKAYLKQILNSEYNGFLPPNCIINKTLPGLGATSCEIESERHSIIIEPNVPAIEGKKAKYPNDRWIYDILGVYKGVNTQDVVNYLSRKDIKYKKIVSTPDSFWKVKLAFDQMKQDYLKSYFLLIDECEKVIQDVDYRPALFEMMRDFWLFDNKAMVSATPLIPSDKGFVEQEFTHLIIKPTFDYSYAINVHVTNCVLDAVKSVFQDIKDEPVCFFINSINIITNVIKALGIKEESNIYCSEERFPKLKELGYKNYFSKIDTNKVAKFNFFTSRFFSAVDIELEVKPVVMIITDNHFAPQSLVDPKTEVKQIIGRFRDRSVITHHITNINRDLKVNSREYLESYTAGNYAAFKAVHTLYRNEEHPDRKSAFKSALMLLKFRDYLYPYKNRLVINRYLLDNEIEAEEVKKLYTDSILLRMEYSLDEFYKVSTRNLNFKWDDRSKYQLEGVDIKQLRKEIIEVYDDIFHSRISGSLTDYFSEYQLQKDGGYIIRAYFYLGKENLEACKYQTKVINEVLEYLFFEESDKDTMVVRAINSTFMVNEEYSEGYIGAKLNDIFTMYYVNHSNKATKLNDYCLLSNRKNIGKKGYKLPEEQGRPKGYRVLKHLFSSNGTTLL